MLNRCDFAYAGRNTINIGLTTLKNIAQGLIQNTANQFDRAAQKRMAQAIKVTPKVMKKAI